MITSIIIFMLVTFTYSTNELKLSGEKFSTNFIINPENNFLNTTSSLKKTDLNIPFISQAPFGEWNDPMQQEGCEEASSLMVYKWLNNDTFISKNEARDIIRKISIYEKQRYGYFWDTSALDTANRILSGYFNYHDWKVEKVKSKEQIINLLMLNKALMVPLNGKKLNNPYFTMGGPERHMVVVKGYDPETREFITNDPGTRRGGNYRYNEDLFYNAIRDYPSGDNAPILNKNKLMIVISKV